MYVVVVLFPYLSSQKSISILCLNRKKGGCFFCVFLVVCFLFFIFFLVDSCYKCSVDPWLNFSIVALRVDVSAELAYLFRVSRQPSASNRIAGFDQHKPFFSARRAAVYDTSVPFKFAAGHAPNLNLLILLEFTPVGRKCMERLQAGR